MRILLDTSVLVPSLVRSHPFHSQAAPWLNKVIGGPDTGLVAAHSLAEVYATLTTLPIKPSLSPATVRQLVRLNIRDVLEVVFLSDDDYVTVIEHLSHNNITGGATYDALIVFAAIKAGADQIVTYNLRHFRRVFPAYAHLITAP
ncbi:MAG: PIN domain-containing protein [Anaerolineae bacterium]|nr:PIN domain-containing protein [Anaerolineae bacterium]